LDNIEYSSYLRGRSLVGNLYRKYWLYPQLTKCLKGNTLDVGCGIGNMLSFRPNTVGVDINPHNVAFCKELGRDAQIMMPDLLPFGDASFNSVLLDNVLEHIFEPTPLLAEIRRVLRPQGVVVIGVPGIRGQASDSDHKVFYAEAALSLIAEKNGFGVIKVFHMPLGRSLFLSRHLRQYCIYSVWQSLSAKAPTAYTSCPES
jgi:SAM-dependent methyltransferase